MNNMANRTYTLTNNNMNIINCGDYIFTTRATKADAFILLNTYTEDSNDVNRS